jgi:uncharacterized protein (DUF885 family)
MPSDFRLPWIALAAFGCAPLGATPAANQADARLQSIYKSEWQWRQEQLPDPEDTQKPVENHLPRVDPATQAERLKYWQEVLQRLDGIRRAELSRAEQLNYDVYRPQIAALISNQAFREYEMPVNADTTFWTEFSYTARRPYRNVQDYRNWIAQMQDIPRYFREQMEQMRAGARRGFTPPRVTLSGRDASISAVTEATPAASLFYTPFRDMPGIAASDQASLRAQALATIHDAVQPAYRELLKFMREEYLPSTRTTLAAYDLPDGQAFYRAKISEFVTLVREPAAIHEFGEQEVARLHKQMLEVMKESGLL